MIVCEEIHKLNKKIKKMQKEIDLLRQNTLISQTGINNVNVVQSNSINNVFSLISSGSSLPVMVTGRTITHTNLTGINLDLYITIGGLNPQPVTKITTLAPGASYIFNIPDYDNNGNPSGYNWNGNFNVLKSGDSVPLHNAGPTLAEFGTNQIWNNVQYAPLRDTIDISTVPAGIGNLLCNNGQKCRDTAVKLSQSTGLYTLQQSYNYNVGVEIIPPSGTALPSGNLQTVKCTNTKGYPSDAIGYPLDTGLPKQQTGSSSGNYIVNWINPIVSLN